MPKINFTMKKVLFIFLNLSLACFSTAQTFGDCVKALEICSKDSIFLTPEVAELPANDPNELNNVSCFMAAGTGAQVETASAWVRFTVAVAGDFHFIIKPLQEPHDVDFAFFHLPVGDCSQKKVLRCMAQGDVIYPSPCMGPTGLMPGETDTVGAPGCFAGNNFLAPVYLTAGETYALCINNFSDWASFSVLFCGTALLGCESDSCGGNTPLGTGGAGDGRQQALQVFPNPVMSGNVLKVSMVADFSEEKQVCLSNMAGQTVFSQKVTVNAGENSLNVPTENLLQGTYTLKVKGKNGVWVRKIGVI